MDKDTNYTERIQVTLEQHEAKLSIQGVQLSDEREFLCQVNGLSAGTAEGKTQLRVFGKMQTCSSDKPDVVLRHSSSESEQHLLSL